MKSAKYTLKFYKGRKLILERSWDLNESFIHEVTDDAEMLIEEAIETTLPEEVTT